MDAAEISNRFAFHPASTPERQAAHETVRDGALSLAAEWNGDLPEGREKSLAITKLEEAMFWANAAVARQA